MNKQIIYTIVIIVIIALGLIIVGKPRGAALGPGSSSVATATSSLTASETFYDFGTISMAKGNVTKNFTVTNSGSEPIEVKKIETSCMCTTAYLVDGAERLGPFGMPGHGGPSKAISEIIQPGETRTVEVVFDPAAHGPSGVGPIARVVMITDALGAISELGFKATVTP